MAGVSDAAPKVGFRSKVKDIMKQYRKGTLTGPPSTGGVTTPGDALPNANTFKNKFDAKKYAFESASAGLTEKPKFYDKRLATISKRATDKPATPSPTPKPVPTPDPAPPAPLGNTKEEPMKTKGGGRATNQERLARKSRRMIKRGMKDVYDVHNVDPYKKPTTK